MAGGCIMGNCPKCGETVWEDEWKLDRFDQIIHDYPCIANHYAAKNIRLTKEVDQWRERALKAEQELHGYIEKEMR